MVFLYLLVAVVSLGLLFSVFNRFFAPGWWGPALVAILAVAGFAVGCASVSSASVLAVFSHPVFGHVGFACDQLSAWFALIVCGAFALGACYGRGYLAHYASSRVQQVLHWLMLLMTLAGLLVLLFTDNLIVFLLGWEMMAIGSFFAVIFEYDHPQVVRAGLNYFIQSHIAVLLITAVFVWSMAVTGRTTFGGLSQFFGQVGTTSQIVAMAMLIAGFGFKAGLVPFHSWLPLAHPAAPSHVSALMSGVIVKAGIYGIVRFGSMLSSPEAQLPIGVVLLVCGVISGLYGILNAACHRDFKRMLAYCTIENVGIISMGLGVGFIGLGAASPVLAVLGFAGALLHTLNHAVFKALLFFAAGNVYVSAHTRNMEELGGLAKRMPHTAVLFLVGSLAIGALPPFGGFVSEFLVYDGFLNGFSLGSVPLSVLMAVSGCALAIIGGVSMLAFTKTFGVMFLGAPRKELPCKASEVGGCMLWPSYVLVALAFAVMFFPALLVGHLFSLSIAVFRPGLTEASMASLESAVSVSGAVGLAMLALLFVIAAFVALRTIVARRRPVAVSSTWGCGYKRPIKSIQYTSKSFARTLMSMCHSLIPSSTRFTPLTSEEVFPANRSHISVDFDFVDEKAVRPMTAGLLAGLERFQGIQNGMLQCYIVYGLGYVIILILSVVIFG